MRLVILSLLLVPSISFAAEGFATFIAAVAAAAYSAAQFWITIALAVYGNAQQRKAQREQSNAARAQYNAQLSDRAVTGITSEAPHVWVYGRAKVGGTIAAMFTSGAKDQFKHIVIVHADHECEEIEEIYIQGRPLGELDVNGDVLPGHFYHQVTTEHASLTFDTTEILSPIALPHPNIKHATIRIFGESQQDLGPTEYSNYSLSTITIGVDVFTTMTFFGTITERVNCSFEYVENHPRARAFKHLGQPGQVADSHLMTQLPDLWPATATLDGKCYLYVRVDLNQPDFQSAIPRIEILVKGKKLYDVRTEVTEWSENPALAIYDYLRSEVCNVPAEDIPVDYFITAANVCDEVQSFGARYTFNGVIFTDQPQPGVLEKMAQAMAGGIVATTWQVFAGKYVAPVMALVETDFVGKVAITPGMSDSLLYNGVRGQYVSSENNYVATDFKPYQVPVYLDADGKELYTNIDFPFTDSLQRVHNLARIFCEDQRNGFTVKIDVSLKAWALQVGERATLTSAFWGWNGKVFRLLDKAYTPAGMVELTLKEDGESIWDFADAVTVDEIPNSNMDDPLVINAIDEPVECESGTDVLFVQQDGTVVARLLVTWPAVDITNGEIEVQWSKQGSDVWQKAFAGPDDTQIYLTPVEEQNIYFVRVRTVRIGTVAVRSDWTYSEPHFVLGKSELPSNVPWATIEGDTLSWGSVSDLDLAGYRWRFHYGLNTSWGDANPMHIGLIVGGPWTPDARPQGQITLMVKAVDLSGNESGSAAVIQTQFGDAIVANVVETVDFQADGYPGTVTGATLVGGMLKADGVTLFYGAAAATFYSQYTSSEFYVSNYSAMVYETDVFTPSLAVVGSQLTLDTDLEGDGQFIEYKLSGAETFYGPVGAETFYGAANDPFYGAEANYQPWPGQVTAQNINYQFRITIGQSATQGVIDTCALTVDVPDVSESLNNVVILAAGTRLPITKAYTVIENVQATLQADGGTAVTLEVVDKNPTLGPLIKCRNTAGSFVQGLIDADVQGYKTAA